MSRVQEFTLTDKQATVAGVTKLINRHLRGTTLRRIEVRFSTQVSPAFDPNVAMPQIKALLREHGLSAVEVSVRAQELAIDDAAGEHRVRLLHKEPAPSAPAVKKGSGAPLAGWLARLLPGRRGPEPEAAPADAPAADRQP